ncbi:MAG: hypothetical protein AAB316_18635, partial [Bacteroidota bacterium]
MLYKILRLLPALVLCSASAVFSQTATIVGPASVCLPDSCQTYTVELTNGGIPITVDWSVYSVGAQTGFSWSGNSASLCIATPGTITLTVSGFSSPNQFFI